MAIPYDVPKLFSGKWLFESCFSSYSGIFDIDIDLCTVFSMHSHCIIPYSCQTISPIVKIILNSEPYKLVPSGFLASNIKLILSNAFPVQQICHLCHHTEYTEETFVKPHLKLACRLEVYTKAEYCLNISLYRSTLR